MLSFLCSAQLVAVMDSYSILGRERSARNNQKFTKILPSFGETPTPLVVADNERAKQCPRADPLGRSVSRLFAVAVDFDYRLEHQQQRASDAIHLPEGEGRQVELISNCALFNPHFSDHCRGSGNRRTDQYPNSCRGKNCHDEACQNPKC